MKILHLLFYFSILINFGQISPFQIIFWSSKLEENNKIYNWENKLSISNSTIIYPLINLYTIVPLWKWLGNLYYDQWISQPFSYAVNSPVPAVIPIIVFVMACYGRKSKFADVALGTTHTFLLFLNWNRWSSHKEVGQPRQSVSDILCYSKLACARLLLRHLVVKHMKARTNAGIKAQRAVNSASGSLQLLYGAKFPSFAWLQSNWTTFSFFSSGTWTIILLASTLYPKIWREGPESCFSSSWGRPISSQSLSNRTCFIGICFLYGS